MSKAAGKQGRVRNRLGFWGVMTGTALSLTLLLLNPVHAQTESGDLGEVVVTATQLPRPAERVGNSVTVIDREEIERSNAATVSELLKTSAGVAVVRQGSPGAVTSVFTRGGESDFTLVLIDGIPVNDPTTGAYDFSRLLTDNVERIEIVRGGGAGSVAWGAQAASGVINIITRRGEGDPQIRLKSEAGSNSFYHNSIGTSGGTEKGYYSLSVSDVRDGGHLDVKNDFEEFNVSGRVGYNLSPTHGFEITLWSQTSERDNPNDNGGDRLAPFVLDPQDHTEDAQAVGKINYHFGLTPDWQSSVEVNQYREHVINNDFDNGFAVDPFGGFSSEFEAARYNLQWQNTMTYLDPVDVVWGVEYGEEDYKSNNSFGSRADISRHHWSLYLEGTTEAAPGLLTGDQWSLTAGARWDDNSMLKEEWVYSVNTAYSFYEFMGERTRLRAAAGQGYKLPSVLELGTASPAFTPNPNLTGEHYASWEIGLDQEFWNGRITTGVTYFNGTMDDLIETIAIAGGTTRSNGAEADIEGTELFFTLEVLEEELFLEANWSFVKTEVVNVGNQQGSTFFKGMELPRRPDSVGTVSLLYLRDRFSAQTSVHYVGAAQDSDFSPFDVFVFTARPVRNEAYTTVDLAARYDVREWATLTLRGQNVFDEEYEAAYGFSSPGALWRGGMEIRF